ncbi:MAG: N-6 DNA methylase [Candidatus Brocadiia bacterium]
MKKSKLTEKPSRVPDIGQAQKEMAITTYLAEIGNLANESAKSHRFTVLLNALLGLQPGFIEQYVEGIEKYVRVPEKDRILRGRADQLSGNLIIEFERDLSGKPKLAEAETQLRQYAAGAWAAEPPNARTKFVCIAADGRRFRAYVPILADSAARSPLPEQVQLKLIENLDAAKCGWQEFYYFLDRHLLRREILHPTTSSIVKDFGPESHAFLVAEQAILARWEALREQPDFAVLYDAWNRYLRIVYGSPQGDHELFARHTYLASLAKLMVWSRLGPEDRQATEADILSVLEGSWFRDQLSIENFLEEDFFSWLARKEARATALEVSQMLLALLRNYNLREISEDVLKSLYEGLVDPTTRHDLGEYYTPDWLAGRMVRRLLAPNPEASMFDPACGSGTFIYMAIREKKRLLGESVKTLDHIFGNVVGMDIHPLACIVAKANYVLALGDLMARRKRKVSIPVYLANSIQPPEKEVGTKMWHDIECYRAQIEAHHVYIPSSFILDSEKYDHAVEAARDFALHSKGKKADSESFLNFLKTRSPDLLGNKEEAETLFSVAETLKDLIEAGRDTIWAFVLKNIYRPLFLKGRFDIIMGNPPWLSYRYVERSEYQSFLKRQIVTEYELVKQRAELITHLELGTLFLARSADLYLKPEGRIGFVLPKSIFSADQHEALRSGRIRKVSLRPAELWDLEQVSPLFNISSCVYFGHKTNEPATRPIPGQELSGVLEARNASLEDAEKELTCEDSTVPLKFARRQKTSTTM